MLDRSKETSGFSVTTPGQLSPANVEEYDVGTALALGNDLLLAVQDISLLTVEKAQASDQQLVDGKVYPTDPNAEREIKLLVAYTDDTYGRVHTVEIPGYNNIGLIAGSEDVDLAATEIAAFVAAFEAFAGPDGGARNVIYARKVARNI